ncbi:serine/threonine-protein phosphatase [Streptomyces sp. C10-9-1]|uniref:PP2C family protein-serine/threonine phosphatase n=1 Tax=Streptomyces sp. C10-9-1 TaxID=1859285 RepID=UPI0021136720|nr:PP2C family protein-serine/threonine phosphatase [Streptomyces sp. C10-9-1]MCQ6551686.1 serine/threonine-protein phosphatase [Streptomyces sp. C10-9-1]
MTISRTRIRPCLAPALEGVPFALLLLDLLLGPEIRLVELLAVVPPLAALHSSAATTLRLGATCALLALAAHALGGGPARHAYPAVTALALITLCSAWAAHARLRSTRRLAAVQSVASAAQEVILRPPPARVGSVSIAASYVSAAASAEIGGDFYAVEPVRGGVRLVVGDVQGKGLDAVRTAATVLASFREAAQATVDLEAVGRSIECALSRRTDDEKFVTAVLAELRDDGTLTLLNHGHPGPLVVRRDAGGEGGRGGVAHGDVPRRGTSEPARFGLPLGLGLPDTAEPSQERAVLAPGDRVLFYTDGLSEARDASGAFYPVQACAPLVRHGTPQEALDAVRRSALSHAEGPLDDDSALLLLEAGARREIPLPPLAGGVDASCALCPVEDCSVRTP